MRAEYRKSAQESIQQLDGVSKHKTDAEEETDLQQDTVQRTTRAPDML